MDEEKENEGEIGGAWKRKIRRNDDIKSEEKKEGGKRMKSGTRKS
jgi:hypothetical protein